MISTTKGIAMTTFQSSQEKKGRSLLGKRERKITSGLQKKILNHEYEEVLMEYVCRSYFCQKKLSLMFFWEGIDRGLTNFTANQRVIAVKSMHQWLPTNGIMVQQSRNESTECPQGNSAMESQEHIFHSEDQEAIQFLTCAHQQPQQ